MSEEKRKTAGDKAKSSAGSSAAAPRKTAAKKTVSAKKAPAAGKTTAAKKAASTKAPVASKKTTAAVKPAVAKTRAKTKKALAEIPVLELHVLHPPAGAVRNKKRRGLGEGSGWGRQSGRGHGGQKSRSGYSRKRAFEGGQMPLNRRLPKRGFTNIFRRAPESVNVFRLEALVGEKEITPELLLKRGFIHSTKNGVKILGHGDLKKAFTVRAHAFSKSAREKIESAGGKAEVIRE